MADAFAPADPSAIQTIHPRQWMTPGWYWAFLDAAESIGPWTAFTKANPSVRTTKTSGNTTRGSWVLFEVQQPKPVLWTLPGLPTAAIKGGNTGIEDVIDQSNNEPATENQLSDFLGSIGKQLGTAGQVLLWGGVAIVLWQVFQKTGGIGSREPKAESREPEYEEETVTTRRSSGTRKLVDKRHSEPTRTRSGTLVSHYK